ncbi:two-component system nitrogen regulation sensor histidine kinase NtrY [Candidatus Pelagibacter ubique]|uniref:histidine kinase n=1 Tax=Pelagibacter ubique TaxID=198252 RepID=A0ABX1T1X1_PELUQ|nr:ATP-binding protein [Candidatus Pelagibacter ubique]NMN68066.1 two-component system nitrogen regulation sensor histidine kinase NtrY [Candidatus Pelagibacter ubique]
MIDFIKKNVFIGSIFLITLSLGFITFLTFIDKSFLDLTDYNLQLLLSGNIVLLLVLFYMIFKEVSTSLKVDVEVSGSKANRKYITFFALFTLIPSILISLFSLFLLSFALDKYLDKKITTAVNNSYEIAKSYTEEVRTKTQSQVILIAHDLNKSINFLNTNINQFKSFLNTQKLIRNLDEIHIIETDGSLYLTTLKDLSSYRPPLKEALEMVLNDKRPLKIINAYKNQSASIIKLENFEGKYLYIAKYLDKKISKYLLESQEALNFYYTVLNKQTGIKISFVFIYLVIVSLLLFLSISIAIRFSSRFFRSINNLIIASSSIGKGDLSIKVPEIKADKDMEILNKNFNLMIDQLKFQQERLIVNERHEAWESLARKLAHEIKNPLTPIQLTIDKLKNKYSSKVGENEKNDFEKNLKIIIKQIKLIENLVNEFSDFARMPKPILKNNDLIVLVSDNINLIKELDANTEISFNSNKSQIILNSDSEQLSRVFFNLIKNSIESIHDKKLNNVNFKGKIDIILDENDFEIVFTIIDNGLGFDVFAKDVKKILNPYFTTKKKGTGLGLAIVNKIINDHNGTIDFITINEGAKIQIMFIK